MDYFLRTIFLAFSFSFLLSFVLTPILRKAGLFLGAFQPRRDRDIHKGNIPRVGGLVLLTSVFFASLLILGIPTKIIGLLWASFFIVLVTFFDDFWKISWKIKLIFQILAGLILIFSGISIVSFTNPFNGILSLFYYPFKLSFGSYLFIFYPLVVLLTLFWTVGLQNVLNFLDGLDGLASGVSAIGFLILALIAFHTTPFDSTLFLFFIILTGAILGFLPYNFNPAKVFLGDCGAYFLGLNLAAGAILASGKIATLVLVLGIPILDAFWVIGKRILNKKSPFLPDRYHLHFRILDLGFSQRKIVLSYYFFVVLLGFTAFIFREDIKVIFGAISFLTLLFGLTSLMISKSKS